MVHIFHESIAVLSHILPPSPSGQATVLHRLLKGCSLHNYCLISYKGYYDTTDHNCATEKLSVKHYRLNRIFQLPILKRFRLSSLSIAINALWGVYRRASQIDKIVRKERCRLLIACTGDIYGLPAGYLACKWARIPFIPYIFDDYAYQWTGFYRSISKRLEPIVLRHAKCIIVTNEYMENEYMQRYGVSSTVVRNPCPEPNLDDLDKTEKVFDDENVNIVYAGAVYHAHYDSFHNLTAAIRCLERSDVKLHLYTAQPESELKEKGISGAMVVCHPHISVSEVPKVLWQADILFLPLAFNSPIPEVIRTSAPGKMGEYLAIGRPILVHAPADSYVSWYFKKHECGVVVNRSKPAVLAEAIERILNDSGLRLKLEENARARARADFDIAKARAEFLELVQSHTEAGSTN